MRLKRYNSDNKTDTLTDYVIKRMKEEGMPVRKGKLPKDWVRVIFKR